MSSDSFSSHPGKFAGKNALVTGGRRGIGRASALALAREGANVAVVAKSPDGSEILAELAAFGVRCHYAAVDLADSAARRGLIDRTEEALGGPVDILLNNAGIVVDGSIRTMRWEEYSTGRELLLDCAVDLMQQAVGGMCGRRYGKIVNMASIFGIRNAPNSFCYSVFKRALIAATECAAKCCASCNVNINCIAPGTIRTDLTRGRGDFSEAGLEEMRRSYPAQRYGETSDIVSAFLYLASDEASFVNGHTLVVDGGYLL